MFQHFYCKNFFLQEEVVRTYTYNLEQSCSYKEKFGLYEPSIEDTRSVLFSSALRKAYSAQLN